jgi:succinoglycan biosynthesis protein ExoO
MQPEVSIVIAAYNAEATLAEAIRSALGQNGVEVEIIVVNDASHDGTAEIARSFSESAVRLVDLARNRGPGGARNAGLKEARGQWVAVLDADDTMLPDRLARMVARARRSRSQIVVDNLLLSEPGKSRQETMFPALHLARLGQLTLAGFIRSNCIFRDKYSFGYMKPVFERTFLEEHALRYDEELRIGEDYLLLAAALARGARCVIEPKAGYVYQVRDGSISRILEMKHIEAMRAADACFVEAFPLDAASRQALQERQRSLDEAASFLSVIQHLKDRALLKAARSAMRNPLAMRHLRMPIAIRLRRMMALLEPESKAQQEQLQR